MASQLKSDRADGEMHIIFQVPSLPPFNADGLRYLEGEVVYRMAIGPYVRTPFERIIISPQL